MEENNRIKLWIALAVVVVLIIATLFFIFYKNLPYNQNPGLPTAQQLK